MTVVRSGHEVNKDSHSYSMNHALTPEPQFHAKSADNIPVRHPYYYILTFLISCRPTYSHYLITFFSISHNASTSIFFNDASFIFLPPFLAIQSLQYNFLHLRHTLCFKFTCIAINLSFHSTWMCSYFVFMISMYLFYQSRSLFLLYGIHLLFLCHIIC